MLVLLHALVVFLLLDQTGNTGVEEDRVVSPGRLALAWRFLRLHHGLVAKLRALIVEEPGPFEVKVVLVFKTYWRLYFFLDSHLKLRLLAELVLKFLNHLLLSGEQLDYLGLLFRVYNLHLLKMLVQFVVHYGKLIHDVVKREVNFLEVQVLYQPDQMRVLVVISGQ